MAPATATVLYPTDADFNLSYYLDKHMPLVLSKWGPHGMTSYRVIENHSPAAGEKSPYKYQCILEFKDSGCLKTALSEAGGPVMGDIKNFSNKEPIILDGDVVGKS